MKKLGGLILLAGAARGAGLVSIVILSSLLSAADLGRFALFQSFVMLAGVTSVGWLSQWVLRCASGAYPRGLNSADVLRAAADPWVIALVLAAACGGAWLYDDRLALTPWRLLAFALPAIVAIGLGMLAAAALRGARRQGVAALVEGAGRSFLLLTFVAAMAAAATRIPLQWVLGFFVVAALLPAISGLALLPHAGRRAQPLAAARGAERKSLLAATFLLSFNNHFPLLLGALVLSPAQLGILAVALRLADVVLIPAYAFGTYAAPFLVAAESAARIRRQLPLAVTAAVVAALAVTAGEAALPRLAGVDAALLDTSVLAVLAGGYVVATLMGPVDLDLMLNGAARHLAARLAAAFAISLPAMAVLASWQPLLGVTIAIAAHAVLWRWLARRAVPGVRRASMGVS